MNCPGRAVRLLPMVTVKAGRPIEPASGPARVPRRPAGAGRQRSGGRARQSARPRRLAQQEDRPPGHLGAPVQPPGRGEVEPCGLPRISRMTAASAFSRAASSAIHSASASFGASEMSSSSRCDAESARDAQAHREIPPRGRSPACRSREREAGFACRRLPALQGSGCKRQRKAGDRSGIAGLAAMDFGQRRIAAGRRPERRRDARHLLRRSTYKRRGRCADHLSHRARPFHFASAQLPDARADVPSIFAIFWRKAKTVSRAMAVIAMTVSLRQMFLLCSL